MSTKKGSKKVPKQQPQRPADVANAVDESCDPKVYDALWRKREYERLVQPVRAERQYGSLPAPMGWPVVHKQQNILWDGEARAMAGALDGPCVEEDADRAYDHLGDLHPTVRGRMGAPENYAAFVSGLPFLHTTPLPFRTPFALTVEDDCDHTEAVRLGAWGEGIPLADGGTVYVRVVPRGILSSDCAPRPNQVYVVSTLRTLPPGATDDAAEWGRECVERPRIGAQWRSCIAVLHAGCRVRVAEEDGHWMTDGWEASCENFTLLPPALMADHDGVGEGKWSTHLLDKRSAKRVHKERARQAAERALDHVYEGVTHSRPAGRRLWSSRTGRTLSGHRLLQCATQHLPWQDIPECVTVTEELFCAYANIGLHARRQRRAPDEGYYCGKPDAAASYNTKKRYRELYEAMLETVCQSNSTIRHLRRLSGGELPVGTGLYPSPNTRVCAGTLVAVLATYFAHKPGLRPNLYDLYDLHGPRDPCDPTQRAWQKRMDARSTLLAGDDVRALAVQCTEIEQMGRAAHRADPERLTGAKHSAKLLLPMHSMEGLLWLTARRAMWPLPMLLGRESGLALYVSLALHLASYRPDQEHPRSHTLHQYDLQDAEADFRKRMVEAWGRCGRCILEDDGQLRVCHVDSDPASAEGRDCEQLPQDHVHTAMNIAIGDAVGCAMHRTEAGAADAADADDRSSTRCDRLDMGIAFWRDTGRQLLRAMYRAHNDDDDDDGGGDDEGGSDGDGDGGDGGGDGGGGGLGSDAREGPSRLGNAVHAAQKQCLPRRALHRRPEVLSMLEANERASFRSLRDEALHQCDRFERWQRTGYMDEAGEAAMLHELRQSGHAYTLSRHARHGDGIGIRVRLAARDVAVDKIVQALERGQEAFALLGRSDAVPPQREGATVWAVGGAAAAYCVECQADSIDTLTSALFGASAFASCPMCGGRRCLPCETKLATAAAAVRCPTLPASVSVRKQASDQGLDIDRIARPDARCVDCLVKHGEATRDALLERNGQIDRIVHCHLKQSAVSVS